MTAPAPINSDRNLLFGILALQMDFVSRDALIRAMNTWVMDKAKSLGEILAGQGALRDDTHHLLEALVEKHLEMHGGDPERSLASVSSLGSARDGLQQIEDADLHASLARVAGSPSRSGNAQAGDALAHDGPSSQDDPNATVLPTVGTSTSSGLRFRILRPHAKGGLGQVSVAHDEELGREVALKEIQDQYADDLGSRSRFLLEAEITGGLEHPGIVPVYGLGTYLNGRPYYAMRFIRGDSLQDAIRRFHDAENRGRNPGERSVEFRQLLGRFVDVCNAIAYAHSRGVLHRDLKPGNVMLGQYGETLIVDWGLAKPLGRPEGANDSGEKTLRPSSASGSAPTRMGSALGTPQFMPPEQAAGRLDLLGPASDVYSLGATLYSLLTGKTPFEGNDVGTILQRVQQGDFPPPRRVKKELPAALEGVCLKAMALKPDDRYASAQALAAEVEHWLADEPVAAYREPWLVRAGRWVRRHRIKVTATVAAMAVAALSLAAATVLLTAANQRERTEKERADRNLAKARKAVEDYCTNVAKDERLKQADFYSLRKQLLQTAVPFYEEVVEQEGSGPEVQADRGRAYEQLGSIREEMGETTEAVADYQQMRTIFEELTRSRSATPEYREKVADSHNALGVLWRGMGQDKEAEAAYRKGLAIYEKLVDDFPADPEYRSGLADSHHNLGWLLKGRGQHKEAEVAYRKSLAVRDKLTNDFPAVKKYGEKLANTCSNLGTLLRKMGQDKEAEEVYRKSLTIREKLANDFPAVTDYRNGLANTLTNLALLLRARGQDKEAEDAYRKCLAIRDKLVNDFPTVPEFRSKLALCQSNFGNLLSDRGQDKEAEEVYRKSLAVREKLTQEFPAVPDHRSDLADSLTNLVHLLEARGQEKEAEEVCRKSLAIRDKLANDFPAVPEHRSDLSASHTTLGGLLQARGQDKEAEDAYRKGLAIVEKLAADFPAVPQYRSDLAGSHNTLGFLLQARGQSNEAEDAYRKSLAINEKLINDFPAVLAYGSAVAQTHLNLGLLLSDTGRHKEAEDAYRKCLAIRERLVHDFPAIPDYRQDVAWCHHNLGYELSLRGKIEESEVYYRQALAINEKLMKDFPAVRDYALQFGLICDNMGNLRRDDGKPEAALEWYGRAITKLRATFGDEPQSVTSRNYLLDAHRDRAEALMKLARWADSVKDWDRVIELEKGADGPRFRLWRRLAQAQTKKGDDPKIVSDAVALAEVKGAKGAAVFDAGRICALMSGFFKNNPVLSDQYAARAVELMIQAREAGLFKDATKVERMKKDTHLDSLRSRDDFKKLVADLEGKKSGERK